MTVTPEKINAIMSLAGIISIWAVWHWGLKPSLRDGFRQRVFEIRDEMFDYAADGKIDFNHPAYGTIRTLMNGYIRFASRMDILPMLLLFVIKRKEISRANRDFTKKLNDAIGSLNADAQKEMREYLDRVAVEAGKYVLWSSPVLIALFLVAALIALAAKLLGLVAGISDLGQKQLEKAHLLDAMAFSEAKLRAA